MSYRSYQGQPLGGGYANESFGYATTFMALDILALQSMYGADYTTNNTDTTYSWSPTTGQMFVNGVGQQTPGANRIFLTIWDGGGNDWYNFSNYTNNVSVDLRPGQYSLNSTTQRANLGDGNFAHGTVYNSFLFNNSGLSYIENAIGGTGNDTFVGNDANNALYGLAGNDTFTGFGGNDYLAGGIGIDAMYGGDGNDYLNGEAGADFASGDAGNDVLVTGPDNDSLNGGAGIDSLFAGAGNDYLVGGSGTDYFYQYGDAVQNGSLDYIFDFSGTEDYLIAPLANIAGAQFFNSGGAAWMAIWTGSAWSYTAVFGVTAAQLTPHVLWQ